MRDGMDTDKFWSNCENFLQQVPKGSLTLMSTYNPQVCFPSKVIERAL